MNQQFDDATSQPAARRDRKSAKQERWNAKGALVELVAEGIACNLYVRSFSERDQSATYEIVISNKTAVGISCRLYGLDTTAQTREYGMLTIGKHSAGNSFFSIPLNTGDKRRLFVEVIGDGVNLFAEALQPAVRAKAGWPRSALAMFVAVAAVASAAVYSLEKPSVEGLSVPHLTAPGKITAIYAVGGSAHARYRATRSDGSVMKTGVLAARSGEFTIDVPAETKSYTVHLKISVNGLLGKAERTETFRVVDNPIDAFGTVIDRGGDGESAATTPLAPSTVGTSPVSAAVFSLPLHVVAGKRFEVAIEHPQSGLRLTLEDGLQAVVDDVEVPAKTVRVLFTAPASPTVETYSLAGTYKRGIEKKTTVQSFQIYPH